MRGLLGDVRLGLRGATRRPIAAVAAVGVLALGIATVTTLATAVRCLLFAPLPYPAPEKLVFVLAGAPGAAWGPVTATDLDAVRSQARSFERVGAFADGAAVLGSEDGEGERVSGARVSPEVPALLGARLAAGRFFLAEETAADDAVVLSHASWTRWFGGDAAVVGRRVRLDGQPATVTGVLDRSFALRPILGYEPAILRPLSADDHAPRLAVARLRDGVAVASAAGELSALSSGLASGHGALDGRWRLDALPVGAQVDPVARGLVSLCLAALLGIVCANVGSLLLARAAVREHELAVRSALGATRWRLARQLLAEGLALGACGGLAAVPLVYAALAGFSRAASGTNADVLDARPDAFAWVAVAVVSVVAGALAGSAPAFWAARRDPAPALQSSGPTVSSGRSRLRSALVAVQVALSMALLVGAGLSLKSLHGLLSVPRGFDASGVVAAHLEVRGLERDEDGRARVLRALEEELAARHDLGGACLTNALPAAAGTEQVSVHATRPGGPARKVPARVVVATASCLDLLRVPLLAGRGLLATDDAAAPPVALVNAALARRLGEDGDTLGRVLEAAGAARLVVGIVGDVRNVPFSASARPEVWVPLPQHPVASVLLVRARDERALTAVPAVAAAAGGLAPTLRVFDFRELGSALAADLGVIRLGTVVLGLAALLAALVTALGTYGVLAALVARRSREMGVRLAMGASPAGLARLVAASLLRLVAPGLVAGSLLALALGRLLAARVYGLRPVEPAVLALVVLLFVAIAAIVSLGPARRAMRTDPASVLRTE